MSSTDLGKKDVSAVTSPTWSDVLALVARLDDSGFEDAEITLDGVQVRVSRHQLPTGPAAGPASEGVAPAATVPLAPEATPAPATAPAATTGGPPPEDDGLIDVTAPMLGVAYLRPSPDAAPFVQAGDPVEPGTTVAILEVMKLMNNVVAGVAGRIVEVCVVEGAMVEYGDTLFRVEPA